MQHRVGEEIHETFDKAHRRQQHRRAYLLKMNVESLDCMWKKAGIKTLLVIERKVRGSKNGAYSHELAFFVSNKELKNRVGLELFMAGRGHWNVEVDNYFKDVIWGEDRIKCKESRRITMIASVINTAVSRIRKI